MSMRKLVKKITNYDAPDSVGSRFRRKRLEPLLRMIDDTWRECGRVDIIDIGGTKNYWNILPASTLAERNVHIALVNLPGETTPDDDEHFSYIEADACDLSRFADRSFHIAHSNSVVEHVGDWTRMVSFAKEVSRIAGKYYVQTPNYWFPLEPHCMTPGFQWLPRPLRIWLVCAFSLGHWSKAASVDEAMRIIEGARLLNKPMFRDLFKDAELRTERLFLLPKSLMAIRH